VTSLSEPERPLERLRSSLGAEWPALERAGSLTRESTARLRAALSSPSETSVVVFGSLARGELTGGSDADWILLVDGPSSPLHFRQAAGIERVLEESGMKQPGGTGTFGALASSHELIHNTGGIHDTNQNLTRRILLLVESAALTNDDVHRRVLKGIIDRYIVYEQAVPRKTPHREAIPRFLLNDVVRYWRTMAVDYAAKRWEQPGGKWALRNTKLRMSRKLLFVAGFLLCLKFELDPPADRDEVLADLDHFAERLASFLMEQIRLTPLDLLADVVRVCARPETALRIFDAYDHFLGTLDDEEKRTHLEALRFDDAADDALFRELQHSGAEFQRGLTSLFFEDHARLSELTRKYGIF
jgi:predicted nucleotidyltransferase